MAKLFLIVASLFTLAELLTSYQMYFDLDNERIQGMAPGAFRVYRQFKNAQESPCGEDVAAAALRVLEFFALWVGNSKIIFSMLLLCCAISSCKKTRTLAAASMVVGCAIYFPRMHPMLVQMEAEGDVRERQALEIGDLIGKIFVPAWLMVFLVEFRSYRATTSKN
jgi:hypothetical protein